MRIAIADSVDLVLKGIQAVLSGWPEAKVVESYQSLADLLEGLTKKTADVILLHDRIDPDHAPITAIERVQQVAPKAKIIILGTIVDGMIVQEFFSRGIRGYLYMNDVLVDSIIPAIRIVTQDKFYLSPTAGAEHVAAIQDGRLRWQIDDEALTVLRLLAEGKHVSQIAHHLHVAPTRIYGVRNRLRERFGADNNEAMISRAMTEGFLP